MCARCACPWGRARMPYITPQDLYDEGLPESYESAHVAGRIAAAEDNLHRVTGGKWFSPRVYTAERPLKLDGNGSDELWMPGPILTVTSIDIKDGSTSWDPVSLGQFEIYNDLPDDWNQPLIAISNFRDGIDTGFDYDVFPEGRRNIRIVCSLGWCLDAEGTTPPSIILAVKLLAVELMGFVGNGDLQSEILRRGLKRQDVDDYENEFFEGAAVGVYTGNRNVDILIAPFIGDGIARGYMV